MRFDLPFFTSRCTTSPSGASSSFATTYGIVNSYLVAQFLLPLSDARVGRDGGLQLFALVSVLVEPRESLDVLQRGEVGEGKVRRRQRCPSLKALASWTYSPHCNARLADEVTPPSCLGRREGASVVFGRLATLPPARLSTLVRKEPRRPPLARPSYLALLLSAHRARVPSSCTLSSPTLSGVTRGTTHRHIAFFSWPDFFATGSACRRASFRRRDLSRDIVDAAAAGARPCHAGISASW